MQEELAAGCSILAPFNFRKHLDAVGRPSPAVRISQRVTGLPEFLVRIAAEDFPGQKLVAMSPFRGTEAGADLPGCLLMLSY
jgi:hypothetical protein